MLKVDLPKKEDIESNPVLNKVTIANLTDFSIALGALKSDGK